MTAAHKPLDLGNGSLCASFASDGAWLSVGTTHPSHGFVELNGLPPFDERERGDPAATRAYRALMSDPRHAFMQLEAPGLAAAFELERDERWLIQRWRLSGGGPATIRFAGRLDRPALAEITEVDPPAPTGATTLLDVEGGTLLVDAAQLPARAQIRVRSPSHDGCTWQLLADGAAELRLPPAAGAQRIVEVAARIDPARRGTSVANASPNEPVLAAGRHGEAMARVIECALHYVRGCTALRTGDRERVLLTDHRLLPLSWTRDAYYQALLLLATGRIDDSAIVADHLRWLWVRCERPDARWMRSHHADGRRKDLAFQIDQQLYPLIELADYWRSTASLPQGVDWAPAVRDAWQAALAEVDATSGLAATTESAADDPAPMPFILSSQILLWYTARRLAELVDAGALDLDPGALDRLAARVRMLVDDRFARPDGWAYAIDGRGGRVRYHDANDLPAALAPLWGFCSAHDEAWRRTMSFAFSPDNPGYFDGPFAGLGSLHTPAPWPLGDVQAWLFGTLTGDRGAAGAALSRLEAVAFDDGMLPEAYDRLSGRPVARDWFAWPGAALGALLLLDGTGNLKRLTAVDAGTAQHAEQINSSH